MGRIRREQHGATTRFPAWGAILAMVLTVAVCAWLGWLAYSGVNFAAHIEQRAASFEQLRGEIMRLDEVLTMSAQMAAATGDHRWEVRYDQAAPELDADLKQIYGLAPLQTIADTAARIDAANSALVAIETQVFAQVREDHLVEAQTLLSADDYTNQKQIYAEGMNRVMMAVRGWSNAELSGKHKQADYSLAAALVVLAFSIAVWSIVLRRVKAWRKGLLSAIGEREAAEIALRAANDRLECRVQERTEELGAAANRLRAMSGAALDAIIMMDDRGRVSFWNPAATGMFGWSEEEMLGRDMHEVLAPTEYHEAQQEAFARFRMTGEGAALGRLVELKGLRRDGSEFPIELSLAPIRHGDAWEAVGTVRDISERKQAEGVLRGRVKELDCLYAVADLIEKEDSLEKILQGSADVMRAAWSHPEIACVRISVGGRHYQTGNFRETEWRQSADLMAHGRPAGKIELCYLEDRPVRDEGPFLREERNLINAIAETLGKVFERRQDEEALRESEAKHRLLFDNVNDVIFVHDAEGRMLAVNTPAVERLGYSHAELMSMRVEQVDAPEKGPPTLDRIATLMEQGHLIFETVQIRKDGSLIPTEVSARRTTWEGQPAMLSICRDMTERKQTEEALQRAKEQTEAANRELERAIVRANQLAVEAQAASAAKGEFVANMSHEIRTPINGVIGMTSLLLDTDLNPMQVDYAETVRVSAEALLTIVNDILDFSKIEAGKLEMENLDFDLRNTLEEMGDLLAMRAHEKGLEFTTLVEPEVPSRLCGDPGRLRQVLTNLVGNAVKFTERGEVAVGVSLDSEDDKTATLRFTVRDTGIGIPEDKLETLFQPFTQADASTTRRFGGTGLGLSISKSLVELFHGRIGGTSVPGEGSTFWFTASLEKQAAAVVEGNAEALPAITGPALTSVEGARILAVDDNATNRKVIAGMLGSWGARHVEVEGALETLDALRRAAHDGDPYRIAVLDMQMPEIDGETLGVMIREDHALDETSLVMMTSMGSRGDAVRLEKAGFAAYLTKPVKQSQLHDCLVTVLNRGLGFDAPAAARIITRHSLTDQAKSRVRVLLAEDNPINQKVALATLEKLGYRADAVGNGLEALEALGQRSYHLVLMDVQMPEMDGLEATGHVRDPKSAVRDHAIPIIALTAAAMTGDREKCLAAGMNDYLTKPLRPEDLSRMIERWTAGEEVTPAGAAGWVAPAPASDAAAPSATIQGAPVPSSAPVFDREALLHTLGGDRELAQEIIGEFLADVRRQLDVLHQTAATGPAEHLARQAHALKGASATVGALALKAEAERLETDARRAGEGRLERADERAAALETAFAQFADEWERKGLEEA